MRNSISRFGALLLLLTSAILIMGHQNNRPPMVSPDHYSQGYGSPSYTTGQQYNTHNYQQQGHDSQNIQSGPDPKVLHGNVMQEEAGHISEHMDVPLDTSKMTEQELQFHYFKMHDKDHNNKLDGTELIKSVIHWHDDEEHATPNDQNKQNRPLPRLYSDEDLIRIVDPILNSDDTNRDGYIDYTEFIQAQQRRGGL